MAEEPKLFVEFKEHKPEKLPNGRKSKPPQKLDIGNGEYRRTFQRNEQPFAVKDQEELTLLLNTGLFVQVQEVPEEGREDSGAAKPVAGVPASDADAPASAPRTRRAGSTTKKDQPAE